MSKNKDNINGGLNRSLSSGQMEMIALGGTIGVGLFMGSTSTIKWTGPSVIIGLCSSRYITICGYASFRRNDLYTLR